MKRKYQVFISSTYEDLKEERRHVQQAILEHDCIPRCMELFYASSISQWEIIKKVIDECDYFLLIIAGRYGTIIKEEGVGYTEKEFDYAVSINKPICVLLHGQPENIPLSKSETGRKEQAKLKKFREKAEKNRNRITWNDAFELKHEVYRALDGLINDTPSNGWIQANSHDIYDVPPTFITTKAAIEKNSPLKNHTEGAQKVRIVNYAGTTFLANKIIDVSHSREEEIWIKDALQGGCILDIVITKPNTPAAQDAAQYKMFPPLGSNINKEDIIQENYKKLSLIHEEITILTERNPQMKLIARQTAIALPYALFETIFPDPTKNHIKVDLYSPLTGNDNQRPSFMVYKSENNSLYEHFSTTINNIINTSELILSSID